VIWLGPFSRKGVCRFAKLRRQLRRVTLPLRAARRTVLRRLIGLTRRLLSVGCPSIMLPVLIASACMARLFGCLIRLARVRPRLIWGPTPIISIKFLSQACKLYGYQSQTVVYNVYPAFRREDFDAVLDDQVVHTKVMQLLLPYAVLIWALFKAEIFCFFFDGGFLQGTWLKYLECPLLRLAGKKTIFMPYGSDIISVCELDALDRNALLLDYPQASKKDPEVKRQVRHFARWADFVIGIGCQIWGLQPRQDILVSSYLAIDTSEWQSTGTYTDANGENAEVVVLHAPNHRALKGTAFLVNAVEDLQGEGLRVRLEIIERRPNSEVKAALESADILAEQFLAGYGQNGVEGMALGKPVLSNLSRCVPELWEQTSLRECPAVSTTPETLREDLRRLVKDPLLREARGTSGREYVEKYHSLQAIGGLLDRICRVIWFDEPIDVQAWYHHR
jgi:glycosyltransferase involved in cell wall biosynthesis